MNPEILSETPLSIYELHTELKKIKKRDEETNIRFNKTEEYLINFCSMTQKGAAELKKELTDLNIPRLKELHITKIIDILPETVEHAKLLFQGYPVTISNDNLKKIVTVVKKHLPEEK